MAISDKLKIISNRYQQIYANKIIRPRRSGWISGQIRFTKLSHEIIENLNRPIIRTDIESVIKSSWPPDPKKNPTTHKWMSSLLNSTKCSKNDLPQSCTSYSKQQKGRQVIPKEKIKQNKNPKVSPYIYSQLILHKTIENNPRKKFSLFNKCCWDNWIAACRSNIQDPHLPCYR